MTDAERRFARGAVRRRKLFLALSLVGVGVAAGLVGYYGYRRFVDPSFPVGLRLVLVILILLNARQNLRQYKYARLLARMEIDRRSER